MSNGRYQGIPLTAPAGWSLPSNTIFVPENIPHWYNEAAVLQVGAVGVDANGVMPPDPPVANQAPGFHHNNQPDPSIMTAKFDSGGKCTVPGVGSAVVNGVAGWYNYNVGDMAYQPTGGPAVAGGQQEKPATPSQIETLLVRYFHATSKA